MTESPAAVPSAAEVRDWAGHAVDDLDGAAVGRVQGLFVDAESGDASWLIVRQGRRRGTLVAVPLRDCAAAAERVWVAHQRAVIRSAPVVDPTRPLLREHELAIAAHFGIGERAGRAAEVCGRPEGSITSQPA
ncbi:MAG TPA: hypothetical protein VN752_08355 [Solirubrobacterales bacterium]|nr:hypothetical protein [Solirubrobacterales bacterium]